MHCTEVKLETRICPGCERNRFRVMPESLQTWCSLYCEDKYQKDRPGEGPKRLASFAQSVFINTGIRPAMDYFFQHKFRT